MTYFVLPDTNNKVKEKEKIKDREENTYLVQTVHNYTLAYEALRLLFYMIHTKQQKREKDDRDMPGAY